SGSSVDSPFPTRGQASVVEICGFPQEQSQTSTPEVGATLACCLAKLRINWSKRQARGYVVCGSRKTGDRKGCIKRMAQGFAEMALFDFSRGIRLTKPLGCLAVLTVVLLTGGVLKAQDETQTIDDMTAKYHFLSADDTLAILDEEGRLKGYIEVAQPEEESDDILSFDIVEGSRNKTHVKFRTNRIHGRFYRFS